MATRDSGEWVVIASLFERSAVPCHYPTVVLLVIGILLAGDVIHPLEYLAIVPNVSGFALLQHGSGWVRKVFHRKSWPKRF